MTVVPLVSSDTSDWQEDSTREHCWEECVEASPTWLESNFSYPRWSLHWISYSFLLIIFSSLVIKPKHSMWHWIKYRNQKHVPFLFWHPSAVDKGAGDSGKSTIFKQVYLALRLFFSQFSVAFIISSWAITLVVYPLHVNLSWFMYHLTSLCLARLKCYFRLGSTLERKRTSPMSSTPTSIKAWKWETQPLNRNLLRNCLVPS